MSRNVERSDQVEPTAPASGFEALRRSPEFHGSVEPLDDHAHSNDHFAVIYETDEELFASVVPFVRQGLARDERCVYVVDERSEEEVIEALRAGGIDVNGALESGALAFYTVEETYLRTRPFDPDEMISFYADLIDETLDEYEGLRVIAGTDWIEAVPFEAFLEYEGRVNALFEETDSMALCHYDRRHLSSTVIRDIIRTHPHLIYDGTVCHNFYYTPPEELFGSSEPDNEVDRMLGTVRDRARAKMEVTEHKRFLRELNEITASPDRSFEEKLQDLFDLGCEWFDLELGALNRVDTDADRLQVEYISGGHEYYEPGAEFPLSQTYCTAAADIRDAASVSDPPEEGFDDLAVYEEFGVESYLGTYVPVDGGEDRTFAFIASEPPAESFSEADRTYLELMGRWVKYELEQRERQREMREREQRLRALVETSRDCIKTVAPDGTLLQMNPAGLDMGEADAESDVIGECVYDFVAPEHGERYREFNERICRGESGTLEFDIVGLEGTRRHMESHSAPLERPDGTTVQVAVTRDVTERQEREAELRQTKDRFETVFEDSGDGIFILDPHEDDVVDANPAAAEMTGYARDELVSLDASDLHPDDLEQFRAFLDGVLETGSAWSEDLHCRHEDGHDIPAEISASAITLDGRELVLALVRDVSERKINERYLRKLYDITADPDRSFEEKLQAMFDLGCERFDLELGGLCRVDPDADRFQVEHLSDDHELFEPGVELPLSETYCQAAAGMKEAAAVTDPQAEGFDDILVYEEAGAQAYFGTHVPVEGDVDRTFSFIATEPPAEPFTEEDRAYLELMGQWVRYELERRCREQYLQESYEITSAPDRSFEEKLERMLDLGREWFGLEMAGLTQLPSWDGAFRLEKSVGIDVEPEDEPLLTDPGEGCFCRQTVTQDTPVCRIDVRGTDWADDPVHQDFGLTSYFGTKVTSGSTLYGTLWFGSTEPRERPFSDTERNFIELTSQWVSYELERQQYEQEVEETVAQLEQSNERLKQFAYAASHDLQEPLRMVSSYLQLLENQCGDELDEEAREYIDFAVDGADRMREMVDDLLAYARVEQSDGAFEPVDCDTLLERVTDDLQVQIEENDAEILADSLPTVTADCEQLDQLFSNLLSNAIKYNDSDPPRVEITVEERPDRWEFTVSDNGIGIAPEKTDRIFEVFKRLHHDDEYPGTGIGLSLCQEIVDNHGGDIRVESEPGEGSTFSVTLPRRSPE